MDEKTAALNNITRAIAKKTMSTENPQFQTFNGSSPLTLEQVKTKIEQGDKHHIKVWKHSEMEIKTRISNITNSKL